MILDIQQQTLARYFATQPVDVVYLFGSQATGKANCLSDMDFAVIFQKGLDSLTRFDRKLTMMGDVGSILKRDDVEVVDLTDAPPLFRYQAIAPRKIVYSDNDTRMKQFEIDTINEYLDIRPALVRIAQRKLALLAAKGFAYDRR